MDEHEQVEGSDYPRGRGYGNDYMRGGEVLGGYGYRDRHEYVRPRGSADGEAAPGEPEERFPQDERAGGWDVPHDLPRVKAADAADATDSTDADAAARTPAPQSPDVGAGAPVPQLENTFGAVGGNLRHSKSYYVTQAQLQQRLFTLRKPLPD